MPSYRPHSRLNPSSRGQLVGHRLVEPAPAGPEQEQRAGRIGRLDRVEDRLGLHDHAGAAAERRVVDGAVHVGRVLADVVATQVEQTDRVAPCRAGSRRRTCRRGRGTARRRRSSSPGSRQPRSNRPSGTSTVITPSTFDTTKTDGTSAPDSSSRMSDAGLASTATHAPRLVPSTSTTSDPISSWAQSASGSSSGSAYSGSLANRSAAVRSGICCELHDAAAVRGDPCRFDGQFTGRGCARRCPGASRAGIVGQQLDEHVATQTVGTTDVADLEVAGGIEERAAACRTGAARRATSAQSSRNSMSISTSSLLAAARATVRMLAAVRPRRPITRPRSPSPTRTLSVRRRPESSASTVTAAGSSTIDLTMCVRTATAVGAPPPASRLGRLVLDRVGVAHFAPWRPRTARWRRRSRAACARARSAGRRRRATSRPCRCRR